MKKLSRIRRPLSVLAVVPAFAVLAAWGTGCDDFTGPDTEPPFPSEVDRDALRFRMNSRLNDRAEWILWVSVTNESDRTVEAEVPAECAVTDQVAYRDERFAEPVWRLSDVPTSAECAPGTFSLRVEPGDTIRPPAWWTQAPVERVLGDSLESGFYRFGARVRFGPEFGGDTKEMIAPGSLELIRCFPVARSEEVTTPEADLPFRTAVERDGLRFRARSSLTDCGDTWSFGLSVANATDAPISGSDFPRLCMVTGLVAFREGEFDEPAWRAGNGRTCEETRRLDFLLEPGESLEPVSWQTDVAVGVILGDSLEGGFYRLGAERVEVDGEVGGDAGAMLAPVPLRLERSPWNGSPTSTPGSSFNPRPQSDHRTPARRCRGAAGTRRTVLGDEPGGSTSCL